LPDPVTRRTAGSFQAGGALILKCLPGLAIHYGEVRPSLNGIARRPCVCKQTDVNCLKKLELYGFVVVQRRIKRIRRKRA
jgi:hypothetical protein